MGSAYPQPGLYSKFFDHDLEPLVEVVRDTVGRHDTFGLACTAKYYEDMGYFGHVNCSENFNARARRRTRSSRAAAGPRSTSSTTRRSTPTTSYVLDEPWSRPGDYVLLRAVDRPRVPLERVPGRHRRGERAGTRPRCTSASTRPRSVLGGDRAPGDARRRAEADARDGLPHDDVGADRAFTEYNGYWLPTSYDNHGAVDEYWACRERAAIMDLSPLRKFEVLGPGRGGAAPGDGDARHPAAGGRAGRLHGDVQRDRRDARRRHRLPARADNFRLVGGSEYGGVWLREQAERLGLRVWVKESTDELHNVAVQGPPRREILAAIVWTAPAQTPFAELKWFRFSVGAARRAARGSRSSPRARGTRASSATSSSATRRTRRRSGTRVLEAGAAARARRRSGSTRSTCSASRPG